MEINGVSYSHIIDSFVVKLYFDDDDYKDIKQNYLEQYIFELARKSDYCYYISKTHCNHIPNLQKLILWSFGDNNTKNTFSFEFFHNSIDYSNDFELVFLNTYHKISIYIYNNKYVFNKYICDL